MDEPTTPKKNRQMVPQKVFDVAKPGKTMPSASSRPVILTHSALPHDPMVADLDQNSFGDSISAPIEEIPEEDQEISQRSTKSRIERLENDGPEIEEAPAVIETDKTVEPENNVEPAVQKPAKHVSLTVQPPEQKEETPEKTPADNEDDLEEISEYAGQAAAKKAKKTADEEELKRLEEAQALIDSKKYVVPIHPPHARKTILWTIALLILLVIAGAAGYFLYSR